MLFRVLLAGCFFTVFTCVNVQAQPESGATNDEREVSVFIGWIEGSWASVRHTPAGLERPHPSCESGYTFDVWPGGLEKGWDDLRHFDIVAIEYERTDGIPDYLEVSYQDPVTGETASFTVQRHPSVGWWLTDGEAHYVLSFDLTNLSVSDIECEEEEH